MESQISFGNKNQIVQILISDQVLVSKWYELAQWLGPINLHVSDINMLRLQREKSTPSNELFSDLIDFWISANGRMATPRKLKEYLLKLKFVNVAEDLEEHIGAQGVMPVRVARDGANFKAKLMIKLNRIHAFFLPVIQPGFLTDYYDKFDDSIFTYLPYENVIKCVEQFCAMQRSELDEDEDKFNANQSKFRNCSKNEDNGSFVKDIYMGCIRSLDDYEKDWHFLHFHKFYDHVQDNDFNNDYNLIPFPEVELLGKFLRCAKRLKYGK